MMQPITRLVLALMAALLASCATITPPSGAGAPEGAAPAAGKVHGDAADAGAKKDADLPRMELDPSVMYDILVGELAGQRGQMNVATITLNRAAQQTRDPRLAERATLAGLYAKRYGEALQSGELWVELRPEDADAREALATIYLETDRAQDARAQFDKILAIEESRGNLEQAYMRAAAVLSRQPNREMGMQVMGSLVQVHPDSPAAHIAMAHLAVRAGNLDEALRAADRALALKPEWEAAAVFKARILISQQDAQAADAFFESYLKQHPDATNLRMNYARQLIDQKQWERAHEQFKRVIAEQPDDADAVYAVGLLSLQTNRLDDAEKYLTQALALRPDNDQARIYLGQVAEQRKRYAEAIRWYEQVTASEFYFEAQARIGVMIARQGDLPRARAHLQAIEVANDAQRVQRALAEEQILREAKQYGDAYAALNKALAEMPGDKDLLYARALIAEKLNRIDVVEADLREVIKKDPKNAHALNALGYTLTDRTTRYDEAEELLKQALALRPNDAFILDSMGWLQYRRGNHAEAIKYLKRALEVRNDAEISAHLGEVLWVMGNRNEAESVWNRALKDTPDNEALLGVIKKFKQ
jgi:tetratricopeptide (TPR) repeat protein